MPIRTDSYSRFATTPTETYDHRTMGSHEVYGKWRKPSILTRPVSDSELVRYVVPKNREGRPDLIANDFYGVSELDWVIIAFNNALDVFNWPTAGQIVIIPQSSRVAAELL